LYCIGLKEKESYQQAQLSKNVHVENTLNDLQDELRVTTATSHTCEEIAHKKLKKILRIAACKAKNNLRYKNNLHHDPEQKNDDNNNNNKVSAVPQM
jgi:hypothetical protein